MNYKIFIVQKFYKPSYKIFYINNLTYSISKNKINNSIYKTKYID